MMTFKDWENGQKVVVKYAQHRDKFLTRSQAM